MPSSRLGSDNRSNAGEIYMKSPASRSGIAANTRKIFDKF